MKHNIIINLDKSIGKVVFIVEGDKKEHTLLKHIFHDVLNYSIVDVKRNKHSYKKYVSESNPDSQIFVVSAETSNIKSAGIDGKKYLDTVFSNLYETFSLDITNAAVYYIFDRDNESNFFSVTESLIKMLKNSRDNGIESNGMLLLSYPCIEAYIKACIDDCSEDYVNSSKTLKSIVSTACYQYRCIDENAIVNSCNNMLLGIEKICDREMCFADLDNFVEINSKILEFENSLYLDKNCYYILSLLSVAFIDLGIITFLDADNS